LVVSKVNHLSMYLAAIPKNEVQPNETAKLK